MKRLILLCTLISLNGYADKVGNGNDPLQRTFDDAQIAAQAKVHSLKSCSFSSDVDEATKSWILSYQKDLEADIQFSPHYFVTDPQSTCAWTKPSTNAPITLSFDACRPLIKSLDDAVWVLIHESTHHLGFTDEVFPEKVSRAVLGSHDAPSCDTPPTNQQPSIVKTESLPAHYFRDCIRFSGGSLLTCGTKKNNGWESIYPITYRLMSAGIEQSSAAEEWTYAGAGNVIGGELLLTGQGFIQNLKKTINYLLYAKGRVANGPEMGLSYVQLESDSRGYLYLLGEGISPTYSNSSFVQIINPNGSAGPEQTLAADAQLVATTTIQPSSRISVNANWLAVSAPRGNMPGEPNGKPGFQIFNVNDPYSPVLQQRIYPTVQLNDLNNWIPALFENQLYVPVGSRLVVYDVATGNIRGSIDLHKPVVANGRSVFVNGTEVYVATATDVYAIDATSLENMKIKWRMRIAGGDSKGITNVYRFGDRLYVTWKTVKYGSDTNSGNAVTTVAIPK